MKIRPSIIFVFTKPQRLLNTELTPDSPGTIYCRVTVKGQRSVISTGINLTYAEWSTEASRVVYRAELEGGLSRTATKQANERITKMLDTLTDLAADLNRQGKPVTAKRLTKLYAAGDADASLLELFAQFIAEQKTLVGIEIGEATLTAHKGRYNNLNAFLTAHNLTDLRPEEFTHNMADKMLYWLIGQQQFGRNTALKNLQNVSQVLTWGVRRELLGKNPMALYKYKLAPAKDITYLTSEEVQLLSKMPLASRQLQKVRDAFILQCWTGLAYADLRALDVAKQAEVLPDGRRVLRVRRQKSTITHGFECVIPLLPEAERILAAYADSVPVCVNQLFNKCLKQIGEFAGIEAVKMTSHVGRKTAGTLFLNAGMRMEVVSKVLGHSSVKMTEKVYAKILDKTILTEFDRVFAPTPPAPTTQGKVLQMWGGRAA